MLATIFIAEKKNFKSLPLTPFPPGMKEQQGHIFLMGENPFMFCDLSSLACTLLGEYTTRKAGSAISLSGAFLLSHRDTAGW